MKHRNRLTFPTIESFVKEEKKRVLADISANQL